MSSGPVPVGPPRPTPAASTPSVTPYLDHALDALVTERSLTTTQADVLRVAGHDDVCAASDAPVPTPTSASTGARSSRVLEVLGYVGGALLLGTLIFLGVAYWDDLSRTGRTVVALGALLFSAGGGALLVTTRTRRTLGLLLLALASGAAGFAYLTITEDDHLVISLSRDRDHLGGRPDRSRSAAFAVSGWFGAMLFVLMVVLNELEETDPGSAAIRLSVGFALVALLLVVAGLLVDRTLAWSLAGLAGWASALAILFENPHGDVICLVVTTLVAAALLTAFVVVRRYQLAVIGCLVLLSLWPTALYQIVDSAVGVAVGLIAAGGVLIAVVVILSRGRAAAQSSGWGPAATA